ncbi:putative lactoylglutathione lyase [Mumia flava]|uniref:Putative lactoylglutathione lyase n=1 Tax=Mumia flava TaxID=1348852 RepID=A0A0B2BCW3_9ACTN|nr:VOC family protein [Mumia flava]PJJ55937.1 putative lactoylglutathione lyase [Mumia flava]
MDWKLELVTLPVTDVDRAKEFYIERLGFRLDVDHDVSDDFRIVQLTPPGSSCSITFGVGVGAGTGAVRSLRLVVSDIEAAYEELQARGLESGGIVHFVRGDPEPKPGPDPERGDFMSYVFFDDPDGNGWGVQEAGHRS